jgi:hypothetical protein
MDSAVVASELLSLLHECAATRKAKQDDDDNSDEKKTTKKRTTAVVTHDALLDQLNKIGIPVHKQISYIITKCDELYEEREEPFIITSFRKDWQAYTRYIWTRNHTKFRTLSTTPSEPYNRVINSLCFGTIFTNPSWMAHKDDSDQSLYPTLARPLHQSLFGSSSTTPVSRTMREVKATREQSADLKRYVEQLSDEAKMRGDHAHLTYVYRYSLKRSIESMRFILARKMPERKHTSERVDELVGSAIATQRVLFKHMSEKWLAAFEVKDGTAARLVPYNMVQTFANEWTDELKRIETDCVSKINEKELTLIAFETESENQLKATIEVVEEQFELVEEEERKNDSLALAARVERYAPCGSATLQLGMATLAQCKVALAPLKEKVSVCRDPNEIFQAAARVDYCTRALALLTEIKALKIRRDQKGGTESSDPALAEYHIRLKELIVIRLKPKEEEEEETKEEETKMKFVTNAFNAGIEQAKIESDDVSKHVFSVLEKCCVEFTKVSDGLSDALVTLDLECQRENRATLVISSKHKGLLAERIGEDHASAWVARARTYNDLLRQPRMAGFQVARPLTVHKIIQYSSETGLQTSQAAHFYCGLYQDFVEILTYHKWATLGTFLFFDRGWKGAPS